MAPPDFRGDVVDVGTVGQAHPREPLPAGEPRRPRLDGSYKGGELAIVVAVQHRTAVVQTI